jgi:hypothetical protein
MKKIPLSQGKFALVDDEDYEFLMQWTWHYHSGYAASRYPDGSLMRMHRIILERMGFKDFEQCDHINHDGIDNSHANLRPATRSQNMCNCSKRSDNTSGYIGVSWHKKTGKWQAQIRVNDKYKYLGLFEDVEEAARVRDEAAKKHYGNFANLNEEK